MTDIHFEKWQGTGNDFILIDDREARMHGSLEELARALCDRHFGVGSDGLILLRPAAAPGTHYHMEFLNPDGSRSFCGNGSRCAFAFHSALTGSRRAATFTAIDGQHHAEWVQGEVRISMRDVAGVERVEERADLLDTGSPHLVVWVDDPRAIDILPKAHPYRYGDRFREQGVNVNFVRWHRGRLEMRTYERGVEAETLSCGTGVTAAALSALARGLWATRCTVLTKGGTLQVEGAKEGPGFVRIGLQGPVTRVFTGAMELPQ